VATALEPARLLVAQPAPASGRRPPLRAGIVRWIDPHPRISLIVKATLDIGGAGETRGLAALAAEQMQLSLDQPCDLPGADADELFYASDFVPKKAAADVVVVGHAYAPSAQTEIRASFRVGDVARAFRVVAPTPRKRISLVRRHLQAALDNGTAVRPVGPVCRRLDGIPEVLAHFDFSIYQCAPPEQRTKLLPAGAEIELEGLSAQSRRRTIRLPRLQPRARLLFDEGTTRGRDVRLVCDTLWLDVDREVAVLVWRGTIDVVSFDEHGIDRVLVWLDETDDGGLAEAARQHAAYAIEERDFLVDAPPDPDEDAMAAYAAWDEPAEPTLALGDYARIAAELAEGREPRQTTLDRHGLDENGWALEERAWLDRMAGAAMSGDASPAVEYGERFVLEQDALAGPEEEQATLEDYARLRAAMERTGDPTQLLQRRSMTLPRWMRLDRRWTRRAAQEPNVAARLEQALATARRALGREPEEDAEA